MCGMKTILNIAAAAPLPDTVKAGDEIEVQLAPHGRWPGRCGERTVVQVCDSTAFNRLVENFAGEVLVDFEHKAETGGDTDAAAWVQSLRADPEKGLMAVFRLTDAGADALANRRLRFLSPVWTLDSDGRPERLVSVGLTNKPNLPVDPLLNRADGEPLSVEEPTKEGTHPMNEKLIELLGLGPEATEDDIFTAVSALKTKVAEAEEAALNDEAEAAADENEDKIQNRAAFVAAYKANPDMARAMVGAMKPAAPAQRVCNRAAAKAPASVTAAADSDTLVFNRWNAMPRGAEKDAFLATNKAAIMRACNA